MDKQETYYLYIDECGDQCLTPYDRSFPIFTLCGILVSSSNLRQLETIIENLKQEFWHSSDVILHSRDIRKCEKQFKILFDHEIKQRFYTRLNDALGSQDIYTIVCCSVLKEECIRRYGTETDIYGLALKYVIQRSIFCVDDSFNNNAKINIIVEKRGKREDASLLKYFNSIRVSGMHYVNQERLTQHLGYFKFSDKKDNVIGLQIADLVAYPISRHIMNPDKFNPAFDMIAPMIYESNGKLLGLRPHLTKFAKAGAAYSRGNFAS